MRWFRWFRWSRLGAVGVAVVVAVVAVEALEAAALLLVNRDGLLRSAVACESVNRLL